jgi:SOS response regulatory protein OraA/RecX
MPAKRKASDKSPLERAYARAIRLLTHHDRARAELCQRLEAAGFDAITIADVLTRLGPLADDARTADNAARQLRARAPASARFVQATLEARGIAEPLAREAGGDDRRDVDAARVLARQLARKLPARLDPAARWRRVLSGMARRGFDEDMSLEAVRSVMGSPPAADAE